MAFSLDGSRLVVGYGSSVLIWNLRDGQVEHTLRGHSSWASSVRFSPTPDDEFILSGSYDGDARIWAMGGDHGYRVLSGHDADVVDAAFSRRRAAGHRL